MAICVKADYLVVGAGAMGMAFADTILSDTDATIVIVDRYARPGGHWTIAYPYVRLHQPSAFYGVNFRPLGENRIDQVGWNKGLSELATGDEVCAYYSVVMHQTFLPSGRVTYYPKHEYTGDGSWRSFVTGKSFRVAQDTIIIDATYMKVRVPAMGPPAYSVAADVALVAPNDLPKITRPYGAYTVVGAGKTGVDACLWLLAQGVHPQRISWIVPRDPWFIERGSLQPGPAFAESTAASIAAVNDAIMSASSPEDLFLRMESAAQLLRIDKEITPTMFRCATVTLAELEQLKKIHNIVRQGRVLEITPETVVLENDSYKPVADTLYIDCTADALAKLAPTPVFNGKQITLQPVRYCQQVFSAAFIAHVAATYGSNESLKNNLCRPIPHPNEAVDWFIVMLQTYRNGLQWAELPETASWGSRARLDWFGTWLPPAPSDPAEAAQFRADVRAQVEGLCARLELLISQLPKTHKKKVRAQL